MITELMGDGLGLQVTPVLTHDGRALPEVTISKKDGRPARQPTGQRGLKKTDAVLGRPYPPGRDGRDYMTPGPWRPDGMVGNTASARLGFLAVAEAL